MIFGFLTFGTFRAFRTTFLDVCRDEGIQILLRDIPHRIGDDLTVLEQEHGRDAHDAELRGELRFLVDVHLADLDDILPLLRELFAFIRDYKDTVPGASAIECGNYLDMNLPMANYYGQKYLEVLENITPERMVYPE